MSNLAYLVIGLCVLVVLTGSIWSLRIDVHDRETGIKPMVKWLVEDNTKLRAALRGAGIPVDDGDEDTATGRHAAKGAR